MSIAGKVLLQKKGGKGFKIPGKVLEQNDKVGKERKGISFQCLPDKGLPENLNTKFPPLISDLER